MASGYFEMFAPHMIKILLHSHVSEQTKISTILSQAKEQRSLQRTDM
jgi:hypothetical protein